MILFVCLIFVYMATSFLIPGSMNFVILLNADFKSS